MYNLTTFIAVVQQAIKKPLVTELLPRSSYTWGWRCERNYVQFLEIGQVTLINYSIASINQDGDRRWLPSKPITKYICIPLSSLLRWRGFPLFVLIRQKIWLFAGLVARCDNNEESQVLAVPGFRYFLSLTAYSLIFRRWQRPQREAPLLGRGMLYPPQFLSEERITQTGLYVKKEHEGASKCGNKDDLTIE